jgi:hypothetical protein
VSSIPVGYGFVNRHRLSDTDRGSGGNYSRDINHESLRAKGFDETAIAAAEAALASTFDIKFAFNKWTLGEEFCLERLGIAPGRAG